MNVAEAMHRDVTTVTADSTFAQAAGLLRRHRISSIVVTADDQPVGIVTERDFIRLIDEGVDPASTRVASRMTRGLVTVEPATTLAEAAGLMRERGVRHLPVVEEDRLVGMVSIRDLLTWAASSEEPGSDLWPDLVVAVAAEWPH